MGDWVIPSLFVIVFTIACWEDAQKNAREFDAKHSSIIEIDPPPSHPLYDL
jgi:hypothetical protein